MKVYVVISGEDYSHSDVEGVFYNIEDAVLDAEKLVTDKMEYDGETRWYDGLCFVVIEEHEVK